jgi:hypothetical protein
MKLGLLVWLFCAAIYLEIVIHASRKHRPADAAVWRISLLCACGTMLVLWTMLLAYLVGNLASGVRTVLQ